MTGGNDTPKSKDLVFCILSAVMSYYLDINVHF